MFLNNVIIYSIFSNCLLGKGLTVKISDFAAYRSLFARDYYDIDGRGALPVRWMAPESLLWVCLFFYFHLLFPSSLSLHRNVLTLSVRIL